MGTASPGPFQPVAPEHPLLCWLGWGRRKSPQAGGDRAVLLLLSPCRSRAGGLRKAGQTGTIFCMWERVLRHVLRLTLGEVVFLPNSQSLTPLHWVPARLGWWDWDNHPAARDAPAQPCPRPVPCGRARLTPCMPGGCVYSRSGNPRTAFLQVPGGKPCPSQRRFPFQQDLDPSTPPASPLTPEPSVRAGVSLQPSAGLHVEGGPVGSTWAQRVEHVGAQLCCSFPA